jgi:hypothetical protein
MVVQRVVKSLLILMRKGDIGRSVSFIPIRKTYHVQPTLDPNCKAKVTFMLAKLYNV